MSTAEKPWAELSHEEKLRLKRQARAAATLREREKRAAARALEPPKKKIVHPVPVEGLTDWCAEGTHRGCGRALTCACPCHRRAA